MKSIRILCAIILPVLLSGILLASLFSCTKKDENAQKSKELEALHQRERLSGAHWAEKYPWSRSTADLKSPFREQVVDFIAALKDAGATVVIENTLRPQNMAFLMCYSWRIIKGKISPLKVPANRDMDIIWAHTNSKGEYDEAASIAGAMALARAYGIQNNPVSPALNSNHITGLAIDMLIRWDNWPDGTAKQIKNKQGQLVTVQKDVNGTGMPGTKFYEADFNRQIIAIGATYGVIAYNPPEQDKGHWSYSGK